MPASLKSFRAPALLDPRFITQKLRRIMQVNIGPHVAQQLSGYSVLTVPPPESMLEFYPIVDMPDRITSMVAWIDIPGRDEFYFRYLRASQTRDLMYGAVQRYISSGRV
jgi:hypothetical protein